MDILIISVTLITMISVTYFSLKNLYEQSKKELDKFLNPKN